MQVLVAVVTDESLGHAARVAPDGRSVCDPDTIVMVTKPTHRKVRDVWGTPGYLGHPPYEAGGKMGAPGGWIEMQFSFKVNSKGEVTVSDPETKGYPSASIYSYDSQGNASNIWQQTESGKYRRSLRAEEICRGGGGKMKLGIQTTTPSGNAHRAIGQHATKTP